MMDGLESVGVLERGRERHWTGSGRSPKPDMKAEGKCYQEGLQWLGEGGQFSGRLIRISQFIAEQIPHSLIHDNIQDPWIISHVCYVSSNMTLKRACTKPYKPICETLEFEPNKVPNYHPPVCLSPPAHPLPRPSSLGCSRVFVTSRAASKV